MAGLGLASVAPAGAATLTMNLSVDNQYAVYVSSSDSTLGTFVGFSNAWGAVTPWTVTLSGPVEFVHVIAVNWTSGNGLWDAPGTANGQGANPDGFIATLSIAGSGYQFSNNSTTLSTNTTNWTASAVGLPYATTADIPRSLSQAAASSPTWSGASGAPQSYGLNGVGPWGTLSAMSPGAQWIWSNPDNTEYAEFSTEIHSDVPEASTWTMLMAGFGALALGSLWSNKRRPRALDA
jgi:MSHA biogenesis protein MshQ